MAPKKEAKAQKGKKGKKKVLNPLIKTGKKGFTIKITGKSKKRQGHYYVAGTKNPMKRRKYIDSKKPENIKGVEGGKFPPIPQRRYDLRQAIMWGKRYSRQFLGDVARELAIPVPQAATHETLAWSIWDAIGRHQDPIPLYEAALADRLERERLERERLAAGGAPVVPPVGGGGAPVVPPVVPPVGGGGGGAPVGGGGGGGTPVVPPVGGGGTPVVPPVVIIPQQTPTQAPDTFIRNIAADALNLVRGLLPGGGGPEPPAAHLPVTPPPPTPTPPPPPPTPTPTPPDAPVGTPTIRTPPQARATPPTPIVPPQGPLQRPFQNPPTPVLVAPVPTRPPSARLPTWVETGEYVDPTAPQVPQWVRIPTPPGTPAQAPAPMPAPQSAPSGPARPTIYATLPPGMSEDDYILQRETAVPQFIEATQHDINRARTMFTQLTGTDPPEGARMRDLFEFIYDTVFTMRNNAPQPLPVQPQPMPAQGAPASFFGGPALQPLPENVEWRTGNLQGLAAAEEAARNFFPRFPAPPPAPAPAPAPSPVLTIGEQDPRVAQILDQAERMAENTRAFVNILREEAAQKGGPMTIDEVIRKRTREYEENPPDFFAFARPTKRARIGLTEAERESMKAEAIAKMNQKKAEFHAIREEYLRRKAAELPGDSAADERLSLFSEISKIREDAARETEEALKRREREMEDAQKKAAEADAKFRAEQEKLQRDLALITAREDRLLKTRNKKATKEATEAIVGRLKEASRKRQREEERPKLDPAELDLMQKSTRETLRRLAGLAEEKRGGLPPKEAEKEEEEEEIPVVRRRRLRKITHEEAKEQEEETVKERQPQGKRRRTRILEEPPEVADLPEDEDEDEDPPPPPSSRRPTPRPSRPPRSPSPPPPPGPSPSSENGGTPFARGIF